MPFYIENDIIFQIYESIKDGPYFPVNEIVEPFLHFNFFFIILDQLEQSHEDLSNKNVSRDTFLVNKKLEARISHLLYSQSIS